MAYATLLAGAAEGVSLLKGYSEQVPISVECYVMNCLGLFINYRERENKIKKKNLAFLPYYSEKILNTLTKKNFKR
tara:strand:- start:332 stop:559 length:228 start_codon:yes stop_codon:yes gene_type:complete